MMSNPGKDNFDMSELHSSLFAAAAAFCSDDRAGLVNHIKRADVLETLPPEVRRRVEALRGIQSQHDELKAKFLEERAALEAKYHKLYEPLYMKRFEIVNGVVEVEGVTEAPMEQEESKANQGKGVPDFWLTAMKSNDVLAEEISVRDEEALKYLTDIKWCRIDNPKGFRLEFFFATNPFFTNSVLTKTYHMIDEDDPMLEKAIGTEIEWYPGKCLTQKVLKKKPKKGAKNGKPIIKTEKCESFFNFFNPPEIPEVADDIDEVQAEELQNLMEEDYDIGKARAHKPEKINRKNTLQNESNTLSAEDRAGLVNALKNKLQNLAGQHADVLESLSPKVRKRVEVLRDIQSQHDDLEAKFLEERAALEAKYQKLYEPLYTKRFEIVNGVVEVEGVTEASMEQGEAQTNEGKGVPDFWLTAMKTNDILAEEISERDEEALKYLTDIKWCRIDDPKGFKLDFFFATNPFFKNSVLTKTYHMIDEDDPILEKAIGTQIEWYPGKCLTQKVLKKKPKKGAKNAKPITKIEKCESFFNFFNPPEAEELQNLMEQDYDIGSTIRDKIIPHAVSWFTGEAVEEKRQSTSRERSTRGAASRVQAAVRLQTRSKGC
ncbi:hypothetical protein BUALT_Bualt07G0158900 [Buddleja alternifolia]|uniref:Nucleosome assembly protein n=1 Tax=Buddleja alternifolia TaxID=168488 RepID=A0AAV6XIW1_9LAMI|nr:hypothetical protein BUALT_Bualt07G0158900 [Buddleja alternifolia]